MLVLGPANHARPHACFAQQWYWNLPGRGCLGVDEDDTLQDVGNGKFSSFKIQFLFFPMSYVGIDCGGPRGTLGVFW